MITYLKNSMILSISLVTGLGANVALADQMCFNNYLNSSVAVEFKNQKNEVVDKYTAPSGNGNMVYCTDYNASDFPEAKMLVTFSSLSLKGDVTVILNVNAQQWYKEGKPYNGMVQVENNNQIIYLLSGAMVSGNRASVSFGENPF